MKISVILPAYNEADNLPKLISDLSKTLKRTKNPYQILIIDDGSSDETFKLSRKYKKNSGVRFIRHPVNKGLGAAMNTGFKDILKNAKNDNLIIAMDADNTMEVAAITKIIDNFKQDYDLILASRFAPGGGDRGIPYFRKILSHQAGRIFQLIFPIPGVREYTCSYRGYRAALLKKAYSYYGDRFIREKGFNCMLEILLKLARFSPKIVEVPFTLFYDRKKGKSKMNVKKTLFRYLEIFVNRRRFAEK